MREAQLDSAIVESDTKAGRVGETVSRFTASEASDASETPPSRTASPSRTAVTLYGLLRICILPGSHQVINGSIRPATGNFPIS